MVIFRDRVDAGRQLASKLSFLRGRDVIVLGLPRGGVPVAAEVATSLNAPLDVIVVRKLGAPDQPELAIGAIGEGGIQLLNQRLISALACDPVDVAGVERRERIILAERVRRYRNGRDPLDLEGRIAVIVDDGFATGATSRVACQIARGRGAAEVILAVPVAPAHAIDNVEEADQIVVVSTPENFTAVGISYVEFAQTSDDEVVRLLDEAHLRMLVTDPTQGSARSTKPPMSATFVERDVSIHAHRALLPGHLSLPPEAQGLVVFAHGSGSSRHSPRNRFVAKALNDAGLGTLLLDLLTPEEENDRTNVFDMELLANRLVAVCSWLQHNPETAQCSIGIFGASTGAGAALVAAADPRAAICAVVSRGGRPDLAHDRLESVDIPTLLIVGSLDTEVLEMNRWAQGKLAGPSALKIVPGASHLFEEPGKLEEVAALARSWFAEYLLQPTREHKRTHPS